MCQEPTSVKREESSGLNSLIAELQVHRAELEAQNQDLLETQSQLAESRDRFERLYNFAPIGYVTLTSKGKIRDINVTGADMLDQPRSRLINMPFSLFVDTRDASTYKNHLRHCNSGRAKVVTELRLNTKMGKTIYVQLTSVAVADVYPNQLCFRSAVVDITGLKNAEQEILKARDEMEKRVAERTTELGNVVEALQKNEAFLRVLLEMLPVGIGVYDAHGIPLLENSARKKLCGAADDGGVPSCGSEIRCLANGKVLHPEDWPTTKALEGVHIRESLEVIGPDGTRSFIIASAQPIDVGGDPGALLVLEDITEHRKLEQQLLQSQKMESIGLLAGGIAHDFNNILMGITGYTQMVHERVGDDQLKGALELVMESADRASELTQNLLAFSRKQIINPKPVDLNTIIANISKILTRVIGEDIEYTTNLSEQPLFILGDHTRVEQVLINLAINARDAMPEGGTLIVETAAATLDDKLTQELDAAPGMRYASMTVRDSGIGMSRRNKERIFEPFFTTKEIGRGTGLGLSIIYGVVKQHNGTITVESEPGKGTTFTVYLPLVDSKEEAESKPKTTSHEGGNEKLLIVEDDQMVRGLLEKVLALAGYQVVTARDGREAVEVLQSNEEVALIISDVVMPKQNGKEMLNVIRTFNPDIKVIFTSGYPADIISSKGILKEDLVFLQKPVSRNNLLQKVREVLDGRTQKG